MVSKYAGLHISSKTKGEQDNLPFTLNAYATD